MLTFIQYLSESEGNVHNEVMGRVYERATALHLHDNSGASKNSDPEYKQKIEKMRTDQEADKKLLPNNVRDTSISRGHASSEAYLKSLHKQGIEANDIHEVHHTSKGIDHLVGEKVDRSQNPHDVVIKTKKGTLHGASLKATSGTLSNNGVGSISKHGKHTGIAGNTSEIWEKGKKKAGLESLSKKQIKSMRDDPKVKSIYADTQKESAKHHMDTFNKATHANKIKHMEMLMKLGYHKSVPYDYVVGEKGTSESIEDKYHVHLLRSAKKLVATQKNNRVHIHDENNNHILSIEHRSVHGAFSGNQVNAKLSAVKKETE